MGNCLFGGLGPEANDAAVKVVTSDGGIMEFNGSITAEFITDEFPGHGIFRSRDLFWKPLPHQEILLAGESYHLLPLECGKGCGQIPQVGHVRSNSVPQSAVAPYRMSVDVQGFLKRSYTEAFSRSDGGGGGGARGGGGRRGGGGVSTGVWKVKLVISPGQLLEILSQEARTQELIESVRTVAKCRKIGVSTTVGFSDQWSLSSSSRNASSKNDCLLEF